MNQSQSSETICRRLREAPLTGETEADILVPVIHPTRQPPAIWFDASGYHTTTLCGACSDRERRENERVDCSSNWTEIDATFIRALPLGDPMRQCETCRKDC